MAGGPTVGTLYGRAMYEQEGLLTTWLPDRAVSVGDVVSRAPRTGIVSVETTLADLVSQRPASTATRKGPGSLVLQRGVSVEGGATAIAVAASAEIHLAKARSFLFSAQEGTSTAFERLDGVRAMLLNLYERGAWSPGWQLVTAVRSFRRTLILIARENHVSARISADLASGLTGIETVAAGAGISITRGDASMWEMHDASPLFESLSVTSSTWSGQTNVAQRYLDTHLGGAPADPARAPATEPATDGGPARVVRTEPGEQEAFVPEANG